MRGGALSASVRPALRPLLPLSELSTADGECIRDQRADRDRPRRAALRHAAAGRRPARRRQCAAHLPLPQLPGGGVQPVHLSRRALRPRRHALTCAAATAVAALAVSAASSSPAESPLPGFASVVQGLAGGTVWSGRIPNPFVAGERRDTLIYLPPNYDPVQRYPVLYLLHG